MRRREFKALCCGILICLVLDLGRECGSELLMISFSTSMAGDRVALFPRMALLIMLLKFSGNAELFRGLLMFLGGMNPGPIVHLPGIVPLLIPILYLSTIMDTGIVLRLFMGIGMKFMGESLMLMTIFVSV
jgi:hypothetical protein